MPSVVGQENQSRSGVNERGADRGSQTATLKTGGRGRKIIIAGGRWKGYRVQKGCFFACLRGQHSIGWANGEGGFGCIEESDVWPRQKALVTRCPPPGRPLP